MTCGLFISGQLNFTCPEEWKKMFCANDYNNVTSCTYIDGDFTIISANVDKRFSTASCNYYESEPETYRGTQGVFGYYYNYIWTYKGCRARFNFCAGASLLLVLVYIVEIIVTLMTGAGL